jgi:uncharacterized protein YecE (DUF72 family)
LRTRFDGDVVCEPRHPTWFANEVDALLARCRVARVAADPAPVPLAASPGGWPNLVYRRLHGSPRMYYSGYEPHRLDVIARDMREADINTRNYWCIFDNTALGEATHDALGLLRRLRPDE